MKKDISFVIIFMFLLSCSYKQIAQVTDKKDSYLIVKKSNYLIYNVYMAIASNDSIIVYSITDSTKECENSKYILSDKLVAISRNDKIAKNLKIFDAGGNVLNAGTLSPLDSSNILLTLNNKHPYFITNCSALR